MRFFRPSFSSFQVPHASQSESASVHPARLRARVARAMATIRPSVLDTCTMSLRGPSKDRLRQLSTVGPSIHHRVGPHAVVDVVPDLPFKDSGLDPTTFGVRPETGWVGKGNVAGKLAIDVIATDGHRRAETTCKRGASSGNCVESGRETAMETCTRAWRVEGARLGRAAGVRPSRRTGRWEGLQCRAATAPGRKRGRESICVVGGGFGGLLTALKLDSFLWPDGKPNIVLVNREERFLFKPLMYDYLTGECDVNDVAPRFEDLLESTSIEFCRGEVSGIELQQTTGEGVISVGKDQSVPFDHLVVAVGASTRFPSGVPGARELAVPFSTFDDMLQVENSLKDLEGRSGPCKVAVAGGGVAGVELACAVASCLKNRPDATVLLLSGSAEVMEKCPTGHREAAKAEMKELGVEVLDTARVLSVEEVEGQKQVHINLGGEERVIDTDLLLWTVGQAPATADLGGSYVFPVNDRGSIKTDPYLQVEGQSNVFALGDASFQAPEVSPYVATAQVALQQSDFCAYNIWASMNGRKLVPFRYMHLGDMMTLGRSTAAITLPLGSGFTLDGILASLGRKIAYVIRQPTLQQQGRVGRGLLEREGGEAGKALGPLLQLFATEADKLLQQSKA